MERLLGSGYGRTGGVRRRMLLLIPKDRPVPGGANARLQDYHYIGLAVGDNLSADSPS